MKRQDPGLHLGLLKDPSKLKAAIAENEPLVKSAIEALRSGLIEGIAAKELAAAFTVEGLGGGRLRFQTRSDAKSVESVQGQHAHDAPERRFALGCSAQSCATVT